MSATLLRASPLSVAVAAVVAAVAVAGFFLTRHNAAQQDQRLLRDQANQAALIGSSEFDSIVSEIDGVVAPVALYQPSALEGALSAIAASTPSAHFVVDVFRPTASGFLTVASAGPGPKTGQVASGSLSAVLAEAAKATSKGSIAPPYVPSPVVRNHGESTIGFARLASVGSSELVYFGFTIDPYSAARTLVANQGPFESLKLALYGSSRADSGSLIVATTRSLPLEGATDTKRVAIGTGTWLLVTQARSPLAGSFAAAAPWVILALGLLLAMLLGGTVEVLVRRHRYASELVEERTRELQVSLQDLRDAQEKLVQSERLSALGEMASVVGHELRNPLTAVLNALFLLRRSIDDGAHSGAGKHLDMAERETAKAAALAEDLTAFVRPRQTNMTEVDLADLVQEVVQATPPPVSVDLVVETSPMTVVADRGQLAEVLTNLVTNAYQAMTDGGSVVVRTSKDTDGASIVVEDNGPGIDEVTAARIFEPFFTTKANGTGLGLAIVHRLVEAHGGKISIENRSLRGARATVRLPVREASRDDEMAGSSR